MQFIALLLLRYVSQMLTSYSRSFPSGRAVQDLTDLLQHRREASDPISVRHFGF